MWVNLDDPRLRLFLKADKRRYFGGREDAPFSAAEAAELHALAEDYNEHEWEAARRWGASASTR